MPTLNRIFEALATATEEQQPMIMLATDDLAIVVAMAALYAEGQE